MISGNKFGYQFKYAFKGVYQDEDEERQMCVPQWFLDYCSTKEVTVRWKDTDGKPCTAKATKPDTFARVRFWQTSKGFYTGNPPESKPSKPPSSSIVPRLVVDVLEERKGRIVVCARTYSGVYISSKVLSLGMDLKQFLRLFTWDVDHFAGVVLSARSFVVEPQRLKQTLNQNQLWQLHPLLTTNKMTLRAADRIRRERRNLETC